MINITLIFPIFLSEDPGDSHPMLLIGGSDRIIITHLNGTGLRPLRSLSVNGTLTLDFQHNQESVCWLLSTESSGQLHCAETRNLQGFTREKEIRTQQSLQRMFQVFIVPSLTVYTFPSSLFWWMLGIICSPIENTQPTTSESESCDTHHPALSHTHMVTLQPHFFLSHTLTCELSPSPFIPSAPRLLTVHLSVGPSNLQVLNFQSPPFFILLDLTRIFSRIKHYLHKICMIFPRYLYFF